MRRLRRSLLLASFLAAAPVALIAATPAAAQVSVDIGFDSFHGQLANYGDWLYSDRWGEVWRPDTQDRDSDWRPYWAGHWVDTDEYGWTWISDERPWGEIAYHYGRWVLDPDDGWLWLPGYVWSPAWVVWRGAGDDVGWMPMPPDDDFLRPSGISVGVNFGDWNDTGGYYGYSRWYGSDFDENRFGNLWVFVPGGRLSDPGYRRYALGRPQTVNIVRQSRNITNYTVVNNTVINRSVNANAVRGAGGRAPQPVHADTVLRDNRWVGHVSEGEQIQQRARQERPHGNGTANSAPRPTQQQIQSLSTRAIPVRTQSNAPGNARNNQPNRGGGGSHLFNRNNVAQFTASRGQPAQPNKPAQANTPAQPNTQAQPNRPEAQPNQPPRNARERNGGRPENNAPENNAPENRGPRAEPPRGPNNPAPAATPPAPERNRGLERPQQAAPATPPQQQQQQQQEERNNRFQRERPQEAPPSEPQRATPPVPERQAAPPTPPPAEDRGNRPQRSFERGPQPPAIEQRQPERPATPERPTPPSPPREAPQRPAAEQRPTPPPQAQQREQRPAAEQRTPPPQVQQREQRPEAARPNPPAGRGQERGANPDRDKRDNNNH